MKQRLLKYSLCVLFVGMCTIASAQLEDPPLDVPPGTEEYHGTSGNAQDWYEPNPRDAKLRRRNQELRAREEHPITTFFVEIFSGLFELLDAALED